MIDTNGKRSIIRMFHVHRNYGTKKALIDITLDIFKNDFVFLTGASGAGKTTLLKLLYLAEAVSEGQVLIDGMNLSRIPVSDCRFCAENSVLYSKITNSSPAEPFLKMFRWYWRLPVKKGA